MTVFWGPVNQTTNKSLWHTNVYFAGLTTGPFQTAVTGLTANTAYYYICYASNWAGGAWAPTNAAFVAKPQACLGDDGTPNPDWEGGGSTNKSLLLWLRADAGAAYNATNRVTGWINQSRYYGNDLRPYWSSGAVSYRPLFTNHVVKGLPAIRCDGVGSSLEGAGVGFSPLADHTLFVVCRRLGAGADTAQVPFCMQDSATKLDRRIDLHDDGRVAGYDQGVGIEGTIVNGRFYVVATREGEGRQSLWMNRVMLTSTNRTLLNLPVNAWWVGVRNSPGGLYDYPFNGDVAEVLVYNFGLSTNAGAEMARVNAYLWDKYLKPPPVGTAISIR